MATTYSMQHSAHLGLKLEPTYLSMVVPQVNLGSATDRYALRFPIIACKKIWPHRLLYPDWLASSVACHLKHVWKVPLPLRRFIRWREHVLLPRLPQKPLDLDLAGG